MDRIEFVYWFATVICIGDLRRRDGRPRSTRCSRSGRRRTTSPTARRSTATPVSRSRGRSSRPILVIAIGVLSAVVLSQNGERRHEPDDDQGDRAAVRLALRVPGSKGLKSERARDAGEPQHHVRARGSCDVIHSFWIPQMGQKQDLVPGHQDRASSSPRRARAPSRSICTELCGLGHATMRAPVRVVSQQAFDAWVKKQQSGGEGGGGDAGTAVFASAGCGGCHAFTPAGTTGADRARASTTSPPPRRRRARIRPRYVQGVDRRSRQGRRLGLPARRHARQLRRVALVGADRRPRHVSDSRVDSEHSKGAESGERRRAHAPTTSGTARARRRTGAASSCGPGFVRAAWCFALFFLVGLYLVAGIRWLAGWDPVYDWNIIVLVGGLTMGPVGFLLGHRRLRLLALLALRPPDAAGGSLQPRRLHVEGLLQGQHRPQGDRRPVPRRRRSSSSSSAA